MLSAAFYNYPAFPETKFCDQTKGEGSSKVQCVMDLKNIVNS